jgi:hypothetical protein
MVVGDKIIVKDVPVSDNDDDANDDGENEEENDNEPAENNPETTKERNDSVHQSENGNSSPMVKTASLTPNNLMNIKTASSAGFDQQVAMLSQQQSTGAGEVPQTESKAGSKTKPEGKKMPRLPKDSLEARMRHNRLFL